MRRFGILILAIWGTAHAEEPFREIPPFVKVATPGEESPLPDGTPVSRPLKASGETSESLIPAEQVLFPSTPVMNPPVVRRERSWNGVEYLAWRPAESGFPARIVGGSTPGSIRRLDEDSITTAQGLRLMTGMSLGNSDTSGLQLIYTTLGSRTATQAFIGDSLYRPVIDEKTGQQAFVPVAVPGVQVGSFGIVASAPRITSWELLYVAELARTNRIHLDAHAGLRYWTMSEGVQMTQFASFPPTAGGTVSSVVSHDDFAARTKFRGGQFGLSADLSHESLYLEIIGKIAVGESQTSYSVDGQTALTTVTPGDPATRSAVMNGGLLSSRTGRFGTSHFAIMPETIVKLGFRLSGTSRIYMGYDLLYLATAARVSNAIDPVIDPNATVFLSGNLTPRPADRPPPSATSDFRAQGLLFGFEWMY